MLRCEGCGVLHHPGCWVTNGGCATDAEHRVAPIAQAYTTGARPPGAQAPHPGEGTRATPPPQQPPAETPEPIPFRPAGRMQPPVEPVAVDDQDGDVIGGNPPVIHRRLPENVVPPVAPPRRYVPPTGEQMPRKPLPQIYERHKIVGYWYVPVAVMLAIVVAFGVIWGAERLFGGDSDTAAPEPTPTTTSGATGDQTPTPATQVTPATTTTATASPSETATTGPGKFSAGDTVVVTGTGDCLNVRTNPGVENDAIICIADATEVKVTGGPEEAGGLTWWKVETRLGEGWAAEDYLVVKP